MMLLDSEKNVCLALEPGLSAEPSAPGQPFHARALVINGHSVSELPDIQEMFAMVHKLILIWGLFLCDMKIT